MFKEFYLSRQLKALHIVLKKGKCLVLGKLQTIQLIEANFQLIIRVFLNARNIEIIENNTRLLKIKFRSRRNYTIKEALLEKKLIHNSVIRVGAIKVHIITNLKACYDKQLLNSHRMVEELVRIDYIVIKLTMNVLLKIECYICTRYRVISNYYRGIEDEIGETG